MVSNDTTDYCYVCDRITEWSDDEICSGCGRQWGHES